MGGNTARLSAERKPHGYQGISYVALGMRVFCPSYCFTGAAGTIVQPYLGSWSQGRFWLSLPSPGFGYFRVFGPVPPPGPFPGLHPCSYIKRVTLEALNVCQHDRQIRLFGQPSSLFLLVFVFFPSKLPSLRWFGVGQVP